MAEPARKLEDIEPDIRPNLRVIKGSGQSTPDRASLKAISSQESNPKISQNESVADQETKGSNVIQGPWVDNVEKKQTTQSKGRLSFLKKRSPLMTIILTVVGGGLGFSALFSPGLMIIHLKEVMVNKFNTQLTSLDIRTNKMLRSKTLGKLGVCGTKISIKCKYSTMSTRQVNRFKKAGIEIEFDALDEGNLLGRKRPKSFSFEGGDSIPPNEFMQTAATNPKFRTALKKAYNPLFAGFADRIWNKALFHFKITEGGIKFGKGAATDDARIKAIRDQVNEGTTATATPTKRPTIDDANPDGSKKYTLDELEVATKDFDDAVTKAGKTAEALGEEAIDAGKKTAIEVAEGGTKAGTKAIASAAGNLFKLTGALDNVCIVYGTVRAVGFAAKTVRAVQLTRYAMLFLKIADQIKAGGNPDPADVAYLGGVLATDIAFTVQTNSGPKTIMKNAMDSFGYKYAAYGEKGIMPETASMFLAGGGLTGQLIGATSAINKMLGGTPQATCKTLNNIVVQIGSVIAGVGLAILSGGVSITFGAVVQGVAAGVIIVAASYLPALLQDIVAGTLIDDNTVGHLAGDAITSGAGTMMGTTAALGGNAPLTKEEAQAYQKLSNEVIAQYNEEDRLSRSPFDITSNNTFLGNIISKILPTTSKLSSMSNVITSVASLLPNAFRYISPTVGAEIDDFSLCQDEDYNNLNLAADPFCNLTYGIPPEALEIDPNDVLDYMSNKNWIIEEASPGEESTLGQPVAGSKYDDFITNCISRLEGENPRPIGWTGDNFQEDDGKSCLFNADDDNKYFYLYYIDQRAENGMDGTDEELNAAMDSGQDANIAFYNSNDDFDIIGNNQTNYSDLSLIQEKDYNTQQTQPLQTVSKEKNTTIYQIPNVNTCKISDITNQITDFGYLCDYYRFGFIKSREYNL